MCMSLTAAPALPATTLAANCYLQMFSSCYSLAEAPALPATTLSAGCYAYMFSDCMSLTKAPDLLAKELKDQCYMGMFNGCTNLNSIKCLATSVAADATEVTTDWIDGISGTGTFIKDASVTYGTGPTDFWDPNLPTYTWDAGVQKAKGVPAGWTVSNPE